MGHLNRLYEASPIWMQNILVSLYGRYRRKLRIDNRYFRSWEELIEKTSSVEQNDSLAFQQERLRAYLFDASQNSDYWAKTLRKCGYRPGDLLSLDDLRALPTLNKNTVNRQRRSFFNEMQTNRDFVDVHTSGTTGAGLNFRWSKEALAATFSFYWNDVYFENRLGDKHATFNGNRIVPIRQNIPPFWRYNRAMNQTVFSSFHITENNIMSYVDELTKGYTFLNGYPSALHQIAALMIKRNIYCENISAIYTSSETLFDWQRTDIQRAFPKARIVDLYMNVEQSALISQCKNGKYHVNPLFSTCWFRESEITVDGEKAYEPIGTSTLNNSTFFINYETNDLVLFDKSQSCDCEKNGQIIRKIVGRESDFIFTQDGRKIGPAALSLPFKYSDEIVQCQIVQENINQIVLKIVTKMGNRLETEKVIREELTSRIGEPMKIVFEYVPIIKLSEQGKFRPVISKINIEES